MLSLNKEIEQYCEVNALDVKKFKERILRSGFNFEKYGTKPEFFNPKTQVVEKIVEVPVEVIKEVPKDDKKLKELLESYEKIVETQKEKIEELEIKLKEKDKPNDLYGERRGSYGSNIK